MDRILILDFGSQTTQLIGRRIRDMGVYTEIIPGDSDLSGYVGLPGKAAPSGSAAPSADTAPPDGTGRDDGDIRGIILSGSPESVYSGQGAVPDRLVYESGLPLLGICYGVHLLTHNNGGLVESLPKMEYGAADIKINRLPPNNEGRRFLSAFDSSVSLDTIIANNTEPPDPAAFPLRISSWMSHGDVLTRLAPGFVECGTSDTGYPAVIIHETKPWYGVQFHPEVTHCERGMEILAAFVFQAAGCKPQWSMERYIEDVRESLSSRIGSSPVLLLISGGVDSTVAASLLLKTLDVEQVHLMYIDTGLMRKNETEAVSASLKRLGAKRLHIVNAENEFLAALKGLSDPEAKRKAIGDLFITIQEREVARLKLPDSYFLAQGTLYTDLIESGKGVGKKAHIIKSHHNVGSPLVDARRKAGRIIEPLDRLYKDEVRRLGRLLGVDEEVVRRHPFPGPGLGVRILGEVTREKCDILREADAIFIEELKKRRLPDGAQSLYDDIWQAFAVLLPIRSVGVAGDVRKYGWVLALRAIVSKDGMTADVYPLPMKDLLEISSRITNTVKEIGRVTYDVSSKPPATIEWE